MSAAVSCNHVNLIHRMCLLDLIHQHNPFPLHHHLAYGLTIGFSLMYYAATDHGTTG